MNISTEQWKPLDGFDNYFVSSTGKVKNIRGSKPKGKKRYKYLLNQSTNIHGYKVVAMKQGVKYQNYLVHRLVAKHFIPNPLNKKFVCHIDGDRSNNHADNLKWITQMEISSSKPGLNASNDLKIARASKVIGVNHTGDRLIYPSMAEAGRNGFDQSTISKCCRNGQSRNLHKGYHWYLYENYLKLQEEGHEF